MTDRDYKCMKDSALGGYKPCGGWMRVTGEFKFSRRIWLRFKCSQCGREATDWKNR